MRSARLYRKRPAVSVSKYTRHVNKITWKTRVATPYRETYTSRAIMTCAAVPALHTVPRASLTGHVPGTVYGSNTVYVVTSVRLLLQHEELFGSRGEI